MKWIFVVTLVAGLVAPPAVTSASFVNWESPHVHPVEVTADGLRLVAVNTGDNRLEVFEIQGTVALRHLGSIPVGLEPVSVRARTNTEVWVVNHVSDSVSIVDLGSMSVVATIPVTDEPGDVAFAQGKAFVSCGTENEVRAYSLPYDPTVPPTVIPIQGEDPRYLATDGSVVCALIFNAGNRTAVVHHSKVTNPDNNPYLAAPNPPPNSADQFVPAINPALLVDADMNGQPDIPLPRSPMILKQNPVDGHYYDGNLTGPVDWTARAIAMTGLPYPDWNMHGHAAAIVDASTNAVSYVTDLATMNAGADFNPLTGLLAVVGMHAHNEVRFEPMVKGTFVSSASLTVDVMGGVVTSDQINPHIAQYQPGDPNVPQISLAEREQTIGDPAGVAWAPDGSYRIVTGRGSNNIVKLASDGSRLGLVFVDEGPTGVVFHPTLPRAYVMNKHAGTITPIDTGSFSPLPSVPFFDPTPAAITIGRKHLYDTVRNSALGQVSCGSCHVNGRMDPISWDLGDPSGDIKEFNQTCVGGTSDCDFIDWHPMKGAIQTQTLAGIVGTEPLHWRGDREDLAAFNGAFASLLGGTELTVQEMTEFENFVATIMFPPNPFRNLDGSLPSTFTNGGNPQTGEFLFTTLPAAASDRGGRTPFLRGETGHMDTSARLSAILGEGVAAAGAGGFGCNLCHALPTGTSTEILRSTPGDTIGNLPHLAKVAQLRNIYRKDGFEILLPGDKSRGSGYIHSGSFGRVFDFVSVFFPQATPQDALDFEAFLFCFATDTHAGVGTQVTITGQPSDDTALRNAMLAVADSAQVALIVKGVINNEPRGHRYTGGGQFQSDRFGEVTTTAALDGHAAGGDPQTWTLVPLGTEIRMGVDRDEDGALDGDELAACTDPTDPADVPTVDPCPADVTGAGGVKDGEVDISDLLAVLGGWGDPPGAPADVVCEYDVIDPLASIGVGVADLLEVLAAWGTCP